MFKQLRKTYPKTLAIPHGLVSGLSFSINKWLPFLWRSIIFPMLNSEGNLPLSNDKLIKRADGNIIASKTHFKTKYGISSASQDCLFLIILLNNKRSSFSTNYVRSDISLAKLQKKMFAVISLGSFMIWSLFQIFLMNFRLLVTCGRFFSNMTYLSFIEFIPTFTATLYIV